MLNPTLDLRRFNNIQLPVDYVFQIIKDQAFGKNFKSTLMIWKTLKNVNTLNANQLLYILCANIIKTYIVLLILIIYKNKLLLFYIRKIKHEN